ncbi:M6 family metalloprotease domain-containing protein [Streptomyces iconiensis]|uniref:M6 family metalloprotease domain-containing protein n=2 Tax=Streptomyces iconiensis TaxID=1384038 RepID=A0ABT6ZW58_9ACTN|nr:M6 family metalloprotease domain-containing protein [Streptomyces iconiensis]MDJ1133298.1 M6 family metalloprotease domain-containing protein [Streptomyces iconiensis]
MGMALVAGPVKPAAAVTSCALPRTDAHHSLGLDTWNASYPRPRGTLDAALLFLSFPDAPPMATTKELTADHFPSTSDFFARASYGKFRLRPHPENRWIKMPSASTSYGIQRDWDAGLRSTYLHDAVAAADRYVDFSRYDIVYLVADPDAPGVNSDATKVVNFDEPIAVDGTELSRLVAVFEQSPPDRNVLAHETGHVFDLPDLYSRPADGKADWDTRVGDWDLMGSQFGLAPEPFGWHKWKLGWLDDSHVDCVPAERGPTLHTLRPLAASPRDGAVPGGGTRGTRARGPGGKRLAVVRTGDNEVLVMEARARQGNDQGLCSEGVLLYRVHGDKPSTQGPVEVVDGHPGTSACGSGSVHPALADAPLGVGESYADPRDGVRVEVTGRTSGGEWEVKVTRG